MNKTLKYNQQQVLVDSIDIEDVGCCALEAADEKEMFYYLVIKTIRGQSYVLTWGPIVPDSCALPKSFKVDYFSQSYTDDKAVKLLQSWVLGPKGTNFVSVRQIEYEDAMAQFPRIDEYFRGIS